MNKKEVTRILDEYTNLWESMNIRSLDGNSTTKVIPPYVMNTSNYIHAENRNESAWKNDKSKSGYFYVLDCIQKSLPYEDHVDPSGASVGKIRPDVLKVFLEQEQGNLLSDRRFRNMREALIYYGIGIDCSGFVSRALGRVWQKLNIDMEQRWRSIGYDTDKIKKYDPNCTRPFRSNCTVMQTAGGVHVDPENAQPGDILYNKSTGFHVRVIIESLGSNGEESGFVTAEASSVKLRVVRKEWKHIKSTNKMYYRFLGESKWTQETAWNANGVKFEVYRPWAMMDIDDVAYKAYTPLVVRDENGEECNAKTTINARLRSGFTTSAAAITTVPQGTMFVVDADNPVVSNSPSTGTLWYKATVGRNKGYLCSTTISLLNKPTIPTKVSDTTPAAKPAVTAATTPTVKPEETSTVKLADSVEYNAKTVTNANLRKGPSTKDSVVKVIPRETKFQTEEDNPVVSDSPVVGSLWYKATVGEYKGYFCGTTIKLLNKSTTPTKIPCEPKPVTTSAPSTPTVTTSSVVTPVATTVAVPKISTSSTFLSSLANKIKNSVLSSLKSSITPASYSMKAELKAKAEIENAATITTAPAELVVPVTTPSFSGDKVGNYVSASDKCYIIVATDANLRKNPSTKDSIVGMVPQGTILSVKGVPTETTSSPNPNSKWYKVTYGGNTGWLCNVTFVYDLSPVCTGFLDPNRACAKIIAAFNGDKDARRIFNEVHYYTKDPHITIGFGHFAGGTQDVFIKSMMENGKMRAILVEEFKKSFVARPEFIDQACKDGFKLKLDAANNSVIGLETMLSSLKLEGKFGSACRAGKFPGGGQKTGYWLNDILVEVLLNKYICAWQIQFWLDHTLADAKAYAKTLGMAGHYGLVATLASLRSSGLMSKTAIDLLVSRYKKSLQQDRDYAAMEVWLYYNKAKGSTVTRGRQKAIFSSWYARSWSLKANDKAPRLMSSCSYNGLPMDEAPNGNAFECDSQGLYIEILKKLLTN